MTIRLIQAGFGGWESGWLNNILQGGLDVKLVAGVDINPEALQVVRERDNLCTLALVMAAIASASSGQSQVLEPLP